LAANSEDGDARLRAKAVHNPFTTYSAVIHVNQMPQKTTKMRKIATPRLLQFPL
jgi:hypothetical protein